MAQSLRIEIFQAVDDLLEEGSSDFFSKVSRLCDIVKEFTTTSIFKNDGNTVVFLFTVLSDFLAGVGGVLLVLFEVDKIWMI